MSNWFKLDNAAKIFPSTSSKKDPKVFRFACELTEEIDGMILQQALFETIKLFPNFLVVLKSGFFWHYLETTKLKPIVKKENQPLCSPIYIKNSRDLLFRVNYYKNRINLEVYHALTDGSGAVEFLKTLVYLYIVAKYNLKKDVSLLDYDATFHEQAQDSFDTYYEKEKNWKQNRFVKAYKFRDKALKNYRFRVIEGYVNTTAFLNLARKYNTTITNLIIAIYLKCIENNMPTRFKNKPITLDVPVNLRKYFKSTTARNFFGVVKLRYTVTDESLEDIIKYVNDYMKKQLEKDSLLKIMNSYASLEHNNFIKLVPLSIKNLVLSAINSYSDSTITSAVSNLGVIKVPKEIQSYIKRFDVFTSTSRQQICVCSYLDNLTITFSSVFLNTDVIKDFFRMVSSLGIDVEIVSNKVGE